MNNLRELRRKVDDVDEQILRLMKHRVQICENIGLAKKSQKLPIKDENRESEVYELIRKRAAKLDLNPMMVEAVYREIVNMCSSVQE